MRCRPIAWRSWANLPTCDSVRRLATTASPRRSRVDGVHIALDVSRKRDAGTHYISDEQTHEGPEGLPEDREPKPPRRHVADEVAAPLVRDAQVEEPPEQGDREKEPQNRRDRVDVDERRVPVLRAEPAADRADEQDEVDPARRTSLARLASRIAGRRNNTTRRRRRGRC